MTTILQRICWNTRNWQLPSGSAGHEKGYPSQQGFGHEEWNFQKDDAYSGFLYGYTYTKPIRVAENEHFRLIFFSIHPETKERLVVGAYNAAQLIPENEYRALHSYFHQQGIFERRATELHDVSAHFSFEDALREVRNSVSQHWLSVKCPLVEVETFHRPRDLAEVIGSQSYTHRFRRFTYLDENGPGIVGPTAVLAQGYAGTEQHLPEDAYPRETPAKLKIISRRQNKLANAFCDWLQNACGITAIKEKYRIDMCPMNKTAALYMRVSTDDDRQTVENQRRELVTACERHGWQIVAEYADEISGAKGREARPGFDKLSKDATRRRFDVVAAWSVDRLGRSLQDLVAFLAEVHSAGVNLYLHQQAIDTTTPAGKALFQMCGVFAEFERSMIVERVRAGIARARINGTRSGKPIGGRRLPQDRVDAVRAALASGMGIRAAARSVGVSVGKAHAIAQAVQHAIGLRP